MTTLGQLRQSIELLEDEKREREDSGLSCVLINGQLKRAMAELAKLEVEAYRQAFQMPGSQPGSS